MSDKPKNDNAPKPASLLSEANTSRREQIYEKANAQPEPKPTPGDFQPAAPAEKGKPEPAAAAPAQPTPQPEPPKKEELPPAKPPETPAPESGEKKDDRKVPLEALHEAREELKGLKKSNQELQDQVKVLLKDLQELSKKSMEPSQPAEEPLITDYDKELKRLQDEIKALKEKDQTREKMTEEERVQAHRKKLELEVKNTSVALEGEGYYGFEMFLPMVITELQRMAATDKEAAQKLDNPDGWKQIFKDTVYPKVLEQTQKKRHDQKTQAKEELKKDASLMLPAAPAPTETKPEEKEWTYEDYMKERNRRSPQPQGRGK